MAAEKPTDAEVLGWLEVEARIAAQSTGLLAPANALRFTRAAECVRLVMEREARLPEAGIPIAAADGLAERLDTLERRLAKVEGEARDDLRDLGKTVEQQGHRLNALEERGVAPDTRRDRCAMAAMQGYLSHAESDTPEEQAAIARASYEMADSMERARAPKPSAPEVTGPAPVPKERPKAEWGPWRAVDEEKSISTATHAGRYICVSVHYARNGVDWGVVGTEGGNCSTSDAARLAAEKAAEELARAAP